MHSFLVVSNDNSICGLFKKSLNGVNIVYTVKTPDEALQICLRRDIDVIFLDILLNDDGANKFLEKLRQTNIDPPIVMLVPESQPTLSEEALRMGAYELLEKPLRKDEIQHISQRALEKHEIRRELGFIQSQIKNLIPGNKDNGQSEIASNKQTNTNDTHLTYKEVFQKFSKVLTRVHDLGKLADMTVEAIAEIFGVGRVAFMLIYKKEGISRLYRCLGFDEVTAKNICFNTNHGTMLWLAKNHQILHKEVLDREVATNRVTIREAIEIQREINLLQSQLCIPIFAHGSLSCVIGLGNKITGKSFFDEDIELLSMLAGYIGMAVENAFLYREVNLRKVRNENILENIPCGVVAINNNCKINTFNRSASKMLNISPEDVIGKDVKHIGSLFADIILRALKDKKTYEMTEIVHPITRSAYAVSTSLLDSEGELGAILIFSDTSEIRKLQSSLTEINKLETKNKDLETRTYSSGISHMLSTELVTQPA